MDTVVDANTGDTTMFVGAQALKGSDFGYVLALGQRGNLPIAMTRGG